MKDKNGVSHPFSEQFTKQWEYWKAYKKEQFKFTYKPIGEEAALYHLHQLSGGVEETAIAIINQSIAEGWKGLFPLKNQFKPNGQQSSYSNSKLQESILAHAANWK